MCEALLSPPAEPTIRDVMDAVQSLTATVNGHSGVLNEISVNLQDLTELTKKGFERVEGDISELKEDVAELKGDVLELKTSVHGLEVRVVGLEVKVDTMKKRSK